jgi:hypothetical protein
MSGRVSIKCPTCDEWMTGMDDLCDDCKVVLVTIPNTEEE